MWRSTLSSENSSEGTWFLSLPVYIYRTGVTLSALDPPTSLDLREETQTVWDKATDSTGGPEPSQSSPTQPVITQLLWVASQMWIPRFKGHLETSA